MLTTLHLQCKKLLQMQQTGVITKCFSRFQPAVEVVHTDLDDLAVLLISKFGCSFKELFAHASVGGSSACAMIAV